MDQFMDWTFDPVNFPQLEVKAFVDDLHNRTMRNVLIADPAIKVLDGYKYYDIGLDQDIFIKSAITNEPMVGMVWPMYTVFPDFLHPNIDAYWEESISDFLQLVDVDGLWVDMNEPANFCTGSDLATCSHPGFAPKSASAERRVGGPYPGRAASFNPNDPPYAINNQNKRAPLDTKTTDADAYHAGGELEYDVHNLYGVSEMIVTTRALEKLRGKRAFVLSRSTFPGAGRVGGHWTGDNWSNWDHLYYSISGMLQFQMFGIPYVGADICGFIGDTTEELCARWTLLGAFYPFARNHNAIGQMSQEPYLWETVAANARHALAVRYSLLPLYYTLFHQAHTSGATVIRPLFFEFPGDAQALDNDRQFLIGSAVLVSPVLTQGAQSVSIYFPADVWYDYFTGELVADGAAYKTVDAPLDVIPLHIRAGHVVPHQLPAMTTKLARENDFYLVITFARETDGTAAGQLYLDDGESLDAPFTLIDFVATKTAEGGSIESTGVFGYESGPAIASLVVISPAGRVVVDGLNLTLNEPFSYSW